MTEIAVHLDTPEGPVAVGTASVTRLRGTTTTRFAYHPSYMAGPGWDLSPDLPVVGGEAIVEDLPGALADSAPDAWGRNLIARRAARAAASTGGWAPTLGEVDYLLGVSDLTRHGALRYSTGGDFLADGTEVPRLVELDQLLAHATAVAEGRTGADAAVDALLDAGTGSLGGARPKASVIDGGDLAIAKFPHPDDRWDVMRWEAVALDLARSCGLDVPDHRLEEVGSQPVLLVRRFDRRGSERIPFLSARSLVGASGVVGDYLEIAEAIADHGSDVERDLIELWRRIALSIALNNTDDHLQNHGFLRSGGGWKLSPLFDVNPNPDPRASRVTSIAGETAPARCLPALVGAADRFGLTAAAAERLWEEVVDGVRRWRDAAAVLGIAGEACDRFAAALDR